MNEKDTIFFRSFKDFLFFFRQSRSGKLVIIKKKICWSLVAGVPFIWTAIWERRNVFEVNDGIGRIFLPFGISFVSYFWFPLGSWLASVAHGVVNKMWADWRPFNKEGETQLDNDLYWILLSVWFVGVPSIFIRTRKIPANCRRHKTWMKKQSLVSIIFFTWKKKEKKKKVYKYGWGSHIH